MLNRTEIIERLLRIRRDIQIDKKSGEKVLKTELDELIINTIGDFLNYEDKKQIEQIMARTFNKEISVEMAMVAIKEVVYSYFQERSEQKEPEKKEDLVAAHYYKKGYR
jgi:hypothetical protein